MASSVSAMELSLWKEPGDECVTLVLMLSLRVSLGKLSRLQFPLLRNFQGPLAALISSNWRQKEDLTRSPTILFTLPSLQATANCQQCRLAQPHLRASAWGACTHLPGSLGSRQDNPTCQVVRLHGANGHFMVPESRERP